ncbi:MAG: hypothetical protein GX577_06890 [Leptolinea sp.]|nr:hypothetical protein [Leptolinea sp.]
MKYSNNKSLIAITSGLIILMALVLFSTYESFRSSVTASEGLDELDMVTAWDRRMRKIREILPDHGVIGYLADWDIPNVKYGSSDQEVEFLLAQYTVAPVVLERGADHDLILGNFNDSGETAKMAKILDTFEISLLVQFSNEYSLFSGVKK